MDEQGIYCPQCRAYVHFWTLVAGRRPPEAGAVQPGVPIDMPAACKQCGYKNTYKSSDLRTRRVPTELTFMAAMLAPEPPAAGHDVIDVQKPRTTRSLRDRRSASLEAGVPSAGATVAQSGIRHGSRQFFAHEVPIAVARRPTDLAQLVRPGSGQPC